MGLFTCTEVAPAPTTATFFPRTSRSSRKRALWYISPLKSEIPGKSGRCSLCSRPEARKRYLQDATWPSSDLTVHRAALASHTAELTFALNVVSFRMSSTLSTCANKRRSSLWSGKRTPKFQSFHTSGMVNWYSGNSESTRAPVERSATHRL